MKLSILTSAIAPIAFLSPDAGDGGGGDVDDTLAAAGDDTIVADADDTLAGDGGDDTLAGGDGDTVAAAADDTVAGGAAAEPTPKPTPKPAEPTEPAAPTENVQELVSEYQEMMAKIDADKFDIIDDGPAAVKNSMKLVGVLARRVQTLEGDLQARTQAKAAEDYWSDGYTKAYAAVPVEDGKALWKDTQAWAVKNNRSTDQAIARWEALMETKAASSKPATPAAKPVPPQTRPSGKGVVAAKEPTEEDSLMQKVSHKALKSLGW
jgi:hypothetical protein